MISINITNDSVKEIKKKCRSSNRFCKYVSRKPMEEKKNLMQTETNKRKKQEMCEQVMSL